MKRMFCAILVMVMMVCFIGIGGNLFAQGYYEGPDPICPTNPSPTPEMRFILSLPYVGDSSIFARFVVPNVFEGHTPNMWLIYNKEISNSFNCGFGLGFQPKSNNLIVSLFPVLTSGGLTWWNEIDLIKNGVYLFSELKITPKNWEFYPGVDVETTMGKNFLVGPTICHQLTGKIITKLGVYWRFFKKDGGEWAGESIIRAYVIIAL